MNDRPPDPPAGATGSGATHFRWDIIPAGSRDWLRGRTEFVRSLCYRGACDAVRIGQALDEAKGRLPRGGYELWVESQLPFSLTTARRYRQVSAAFGRFAAAQFGRFDPSALYVLARERTPQAAREHAVALAEGGETVTHAMALEIVDAYRPFEVGKAEVRRYEATAQRARGKGEGKAERVIAAEDRVRAGHWDALVSLVDGCSAVELSRVEDTDDEEPVYAVACRRPDHDDGPRHVVRVSLDLAVLAASGREPQKRCGGCKAVIAVGLFSRNRRMPGGVMDRCKACEKARRKALRAEKRIDPGAVERRKREREAKRAEREREAEGDAQVA